jgi:hypothetical protein
MKFILAGLLVCTLFLGQIAYSQAAEEIYMTGNVTEYKAGKSITITDGEGNSHTFSIFEDTEIYGDIQKNSVVDVEALDDRAGYIGVIGEMDDEVPSDEEVPAI